MDELKTNILVSIALIFNDNEEILITKRNHLTDQAGMWEFPGGKVENYETPEMALIREVKEEVDLNILGFSFLTKIQYRYPTKTVTLLVYKVDKYSGIAKCLESQEDMLWSSLKNLNKFKFPVANQEIISLLLR